MNRERRLPCQDQRPYWKVVVSLILSLMGTLLFVVVGVKLLLFFMPFVIGWFLAYLASPLVNWMEKRLRIVKKLGSAFIIILALAVVILLIYLVVSWMWRETYSLSRNIPHMYVDLERGLQKIGGNLEGVFEKLPAGVQSGLNSSLKDLDKTMGDVIRKISTPTVTAAGNMAKKIPAILVSTIVTVISAYFLIAEREGVLRWAKRVTPDPIVERMSLVMSNLKYAVGGYFRAQFKIMGVVFVLLLIGFLVTGVRFSGLLALAVALLDFLPFFGTGTALIPWAVYKLMVGNYKMAIALVVLYVVTQLARQLIQPKLVGDSIGLNPLLTLVLLYGGYKIGGVAAMIFAVPVGMIVINLYKAGAFDYILDDVKILVDGIMKLRKP